MRRIKNKNNKAQFFALYLLIITLFFCAFGIFMYITQQDGLKNSVSESSDLLKYYKEKELFNIQEQGLFIGWSVQNLDSFGTEEFIEKIENNYITFLKQETEYSQFLKSNTLFNDISLNSFSNEDIVSGGIIYDFEFSGDDLIIKRENLVKKFFIRPDLDKAINYPVLVEDDFSNELVISKQELEEIKQGI